MVSLVDGVDVKRVLVIRCRATRFNCRFLICAHLTISFKHQFAIERFFIRDCKFIQISLQSESGGSQSGQVYYYYAMDRFVRFCLIPWIKLPWVHSSSSYSLPYPRLSSSQSVSHVPANQQWSSIEETRQSAASTDRYPLGQSEGVGQAVSYCVCHVTHRERVVFDDQPLVRCHLTLQDWLTDCLRLNTARSFVPFSPHDGLDAQAHHSLPRVTIPWSDHGWWWWLRRRLDGGCRCKFFMILSAGNNWLCV